MVPSLSVSCPLIKTGTIRQGACTPVSLHLEVRTEIAKCVGMDNNQGDRTYTVGGANSGGFNSAGQSWRPSWLDGGVSPPSFGPFPSGVAPGSRSVTDAPRPMAGSSVGRGRAHMLASMLAAATPVVGQTKSKYAEDERSPEESENSSGSEGEEEMLARMQEHQKEWSREMEAMQNKGRELEQAMEVLLLRKNQKEERRKGINPAAPGFRPVLSSTCAYGMGPVHNEVSLESGEGGSFSSTRETYSAVRKRKDVPGSASNVQSQYAIRGGGQPVQPVKTDMNSPVVHPQSVPSVVQMHSTNLVNAHNFPSALVNQPSGQHQHQVSSSSVLHNQHLQCQHQAIPSALHDHNIQSQLGRQSIYDRQGMLQSAPHVASQEKMSVPLALGPTSASAAGFASASATQGYVPSFSGDAGHARPGSHPYQSPVVNPAVPAPSRNAAADVSNVSLGALQSVMRRDLKFKSFGTGKDKLDYLQAEKQIRRAERKGYESYEIIDAVVEALPAGSEFRSVLLLKSSLLTVDELLDLLHSEYLEVDNSDLLTQLTTARQTAKEDEMTFLNRLIKLKERILYEAQVKIGPEALMEMVLKSLESGLSNERIVTRLLPLFSQQTVSDALLKKEMSRAMRSCTLRKDKKEVNAQVKMVDGESRKSKEDELIMMAKALHEDVAEVKQVTRRLVSTPPMPFHPLQNQPFQQQQQQQQQQQPQHPHPQQQQKQSHSQQQQEFLENLTNQPWFRKKVFGCSDCILAGTPTLCNHCLKCGSTGHKVKDCPEKENTAPATSNSNRSWSRK